MTSLLLAGVLAMALPVLGSTKVVELASGVDARSTSGLMNIQGNEPSALATEASLTLLSGVRTRSERTSFQLRYAPQIYYQHPNANSIERPLFLHGLGSSYQSALSRRVGLTWDFSGTAGSLNYTSLLRTFEQGTAGTTNGFIPALYGTTNLGVSYRATRQNQVSLLTNTAYRTTLLDSNQSGGLPPTINAAITLQDSWKFSNSDHLTTSIYSGYVHRFGESTLELGDNLGGGASIGWGRQLSRVSELNLSAGLGMSKPENIKVPSWFPTAQVSYIDQSHAFSSVWNVELSAGLRGFLDPVLATFRPQAFGQVGVSGRHGRHVRSDLQASISAIVSEKPQETPTYDSYANCGLGVAYFFFPGLSARAGSNASVRAGHFKALNSVPTQPTFTGTLSLRYTMGSDQQQGSWL